MPGICGVIDPAGGELCLPAGLLCHLPDYRVDARRPDDRVAIAWAGRGGDSPEAAWVDEGGVAVCVFGEPVESHTGAEITSCWVHRHYVRDGAVPFALLDGSFQMVVVDRGRRQVHVITDPLGSLPVYTCRSGGRMAFSPEAKVLFAATGSVPQLDPSGVLHFLTAGYTPGRKTVFAGVEALAPGSYVVVSFDGNTVDENRYFRMDYRPRRDLRKRRNAEAALHEAMIRGATAVSGSGGPFEVMLSGGLDSRAILATLGEIGRMPAGAFAWGVRDDLEGSDPQLAGRIAKEFGVPLRFYRYDTDTFVDRARDWCGISELSTDNVGWLAEGAPALVEAYESPAKWMLTGDECWGVGGYVRTEEEARECVLPPQVPGALETLLQPRVRGEANASWRATIDAVLGDCPNDAFADRSDFLYVHARLCRFVFSLGYYKRIAVPLRRPFTARAVFEFMQGVPSKYRAYKNLFVSTMKRYYPRVMQFPDASVDSLPDWEYAVLQEGPLRTMVTELLSDEICDMPALAGSLDADAYRTARDAFWARRAEPMHRTPDIDRTWYGRALGDRIKRQSVVLDRVRRATGRTTRKRQRSPLQVFLALAQVRMMDDTMGSWTRDRLPERVWANLNPERNGRDSRQ